MPLQIVVEPGQALSSDQHSSLSKSRPFSLVGVYARVATDGADGTDKQDEPKTADGEPRPVESSFSLELDDWLSGAISLEDCSNGPISMKLVSPQGATVGRWPIAGQDTGRDATEGASDGAGKDPKVVWRLDAKVVSAIMKEIAVTKPQKVKELWVNFSVEDNSSVQGMPALIAPVSTQERWESIRKKAGAKNGQINTAELLSADSYLTLQKQVLSSAQRLDVSASGNAVLSLPNERNPYGWVWGIRGYSAAWIGVIKAEGDQDARQHAQLLLPAERTDSEPDSVVEAAIQSGIYSEGDLIAEPDRFYQESALGPNCTPFDRPNRIIGERSFHSILRIEIPEISSDPSLVTIPPQVYRPSNPFKPIVLPTVPLESPGLLRRGADAIRSTFGFATQPAFSVTTVASPFDSLRTYFAAQTGGRKLLNSRNPIIWDGPSSAAQVASLAGGHIIDFRVRWRSAGYSLGNVAHTLTLAPRQTRRITTMDWSRRESARRSEVTSLSDRVRTSTSRHRDYFDAVSSNLSEWSRGGSRSSSTGGAGGLGFGINGFVIGGGGSHGSASSSSWQRGGRQIAAQEQQSLHDAIRQWGDAVREFESSVVQEVGQDESVVGITEVIRNPNYCHALTVIYHEILRHLTVTVEPVGVRECLFVPLAIKPFTAESALRWRDTLSSSLLDRKFRRAFEHLDEVVDEFKGSDIPDGERRDVLIRFVQGHIDLVLKIAMPQDPDDGEEFGLEKWNRIVRFLSEHPKSVFRRLAQTAVNARSLAWHRQIVPGVAAKWCNELRFESPNGRVVGDFDFTLVSGYRSNQIVRIAFSYRPPDNQPLTRRQLENIRLVCPHLPGGSVANLRVFNAHYHTDTFNRQVNFRTTGDDLVEPISGDTEPNGAIIDLPPTSWETRNVREELRRAVGQLVDHLNEHVEHYHKSIWWRMDRDRLYMFLDGYYLSPGDNRSIASVVEREPIAIVGNTIVFRVASGAFLGIDNHKDPESLKNHYLSTIAPSEALSVALPTPGLYAQAIMDRCEACEKHQGSIDWVLNDSDPELEAIGAQILQSRRSTPDGMTPTDLPASIVNLQAAPSAPDPTGFASILGALTKSDAFRDMAGLEGTQQAASAAMQAAAGLASQFGSKAAELRKAEMGTQSVDRKLSAIDRAHERKLIDDATRSDLVKQALEDMSPNLPSPGLTQEKSVKDVLDRASKSPGNSIEVSRTSAAGSESVAVGRPVGSANPILASSTGPLSSPLPKFFVQRSVGDPKRATNSVTDVQNTLHRLSDLGFDWAGVGGPSEPDDGLLHAIRLFGSIVRGEARIKPEVQALLEPGSETERWLQALNAPRWQRLGDGGVDQGFRWKPDDPAATDRWGTSWLVDCIETAGMAYLELRDEATVREINLHELSPPQGGFNAPHTGHQTGLNVDIKLPRTDGAVGGGVTHALPQYDQVATRAILLALQEGFGRNHITKYKIFFNDPVLIAEGLCKALDDHDNHIHVRIFPPEIGDIVVDLVNVPPTYI